LREHALKLYPHSDFAKAERIAEGLLKAAGGADPRNVTRTLEMLQMLERRMGVSHTL
jgi:hypothetical protein